MLQAQYIYGVTIGNEAPFSRIPNIIIGEWVYYGNRFAPDEPKWQELLFHRVTGSDQDLPQIGDIVISQGDVSVRQGPIFRKGHDLLLQQTIGGIVRKGERLEVQEVRKPFPGNPPDMEDGSVWIRFIRMR